MFLIDEDLKLVKKVFGGELHHVGLNDKKDPAIQKGSKATLARILKLIPRVSRSNNILFLGTATGGVPKHFQAECQCKIECLHPGEKDNKQLEKAIKKLEAEKTFHVTKGPLTEIPHGLETFDYVIALDTIYSVIDKSELFRNVLRVLKPEGRFVFTDYLTTDKLNKTEESNIISALGVDKIYSKADYELLARKNNMYKVYLKPFPDAVKKHYKLIDENVSKATFSAAEKKSALMIHYGAISSAVKKGGLSWGLMMFQKIND